MTVHFICAVRDRQLDAFLRPFTAESIGQAQRAFTDEVNRKDSDMYKHPEDYELFQIGTFDTNTGEIQATAKPVQVALASNLFQPNKHDF